MDSIIYYMPGIVGFEATRYQDRNLSEIFEFFKLVAPNTCIIDRTSNNALQLPFSTKNLYNIPSENDFSKDCSFEELCIERATDLANTNDPLKIFYSGGLDSTVVVLSFINLIDQHKISADQIEIFTTPYAIIENPETWKMILNRKITISSAADGLKLMGSTAPNDIHNRYIFGESADQLFGSDIILTDFSFFNQSANTDSLVKYAKSRGVTNFFNETINRLENLLKSSPVELDNMSDFLWWMNISIKWQSVALRALSVSNFLNAVNTVDDLERFRSFFNTEKFQHISIFGKLKKWGEIPSHETYKFEAREFIRKFSELRRYADTKIKVPSLYRVLSSSEFNYSVLKVRNEKIINSPSLR